jgi:hypothetical protein
MLRLVSVSKTGGGHPTPPSLEEDSLLIECQSADPAVHRACVEIAQKCVWVIQAVLREEERGDAFEAFYCEARAVIEGSLLNRRLDHDSSQSVSSGPGRP